MKQFVTAVIRYLIFHAPWGVREAILEACIDRTGCTEIGFRLFQKLKIIEIGARGDRGIITSAWNDLFVLPEYAATGTFAPTVMGALENFYGAGAGTYIDIGANIGLTTIPVARNPRIHCLAFEPEPLNFSFLKRNLARNAADASVDFHQVALFHSRASLSLAVADRNIGDHRLAVEPVLGRHVIEVPAAPLDDFLDQIKGPLAVKIDTQGAEPYVVAGGHAVLGRAGLLIMEFCPYLIGQLGGDPQVIVNLLSSFNRVAVMTGGQAEVPKYIPPEEAQHILRHKLQTAAQYDGDYLDIIALRNP